MASAVKVSDAEMSEIRRAAALQHRSLSGQAEYWLRLGRAVERDPRFGHARIEQALQGLVAPMALESDLQDAYFEKLASSQWEASPVEDAFFSEMRVNGEGVGLDDRGNIVFGQNAKAAKR